MSPTFDRSAEVDRLSAVRDARARIAQHPDSAAAHAHLAETLVRVSDRRLRGRHANEATAAAQAAVRLAPDEAWCHHVVGLVALARQRDADAVRAFKAGLALDPMHPALHNDLGVALQRMGFKREAVHAYGTASQIDPEDSLHHDNARSVVAVQVSVVAIVVVQAVRLVFFERYDWLEETDLLPLAAIAVGVGAIFGGRELLKRRQARVLGVPAADPEVMRRLRRAQRQQALAIGWFGGVALAGFAVLAVLVTAALTLG